MGPEVPVKRPSHVKPMLANSCRQTQIGVCVNDTTTCWQKVDENRDKFYLSPTVCQHVVVSSVHTNILVCQHELANGSLTCEGRLGAIVLL